MPNLTEGSPNVSNRKKMSYDNCFAEYEDDAWRINTNEKKKRSSTEDGNLGASKKKKPNLKDDQIMAESAIPRFSYKQPEPSRGSQLFLSMEKDENYARIMTKAFKKLNGKENFEEMARKALQLIKINNHLVDEHGENITDEAALQGMSTCLELFLSFHCASFHLCPLNIFHLRIGTVPSKSAQPIKVQTSANSA